MAGNGVERVERENLAWVTVDTCKGCGWTVSLPGRGPANVGCGRCKADMDVVHVRVLTDEQVNLIREFVRYWDKVVCLCGANGRHHVKHREAGGTFLYCRRCGDELKEVDVDKLRKQGPDQPAPNGHRGG